MGMLTAQCLKDKEGKFISQWKRLQSVLSFHFERLKKFKPQEITLYTYNVYNIRLLGFYNYDDAHVGDNDP